MARLVFIILVTIHSFFLFKSESYAYDQNYFEEILNVYEKRVHHRLLSRLPTSDRSNLDRVTLNYLDNPYLITFAFTSGRDKAIYISSGFLNGLFQVVDCLLIEAQFDMVNNCDKYFDYFIKAILEKRIPRSAAEFELGRNGETLARWSSDSQLNKTRNVMLLSAIISVISHELGHHVVGFNRNGDSLEQRRRLESSVDSWAFSRLDAIGEKPLLGAALSLFYVSQWERYRKNLRERDGSSLEFRQLPSVHYSPQTRIRRLFETNCRGQSLSSGEKRACALLHRVVLRME